MKFSFTNWFQNPNPRSIFLAIATILLGVLNGVQAQQTCPYTVEMIDSFGDGWNGHTLTINSNGVETVHTLVNGDYGTSTFFVTDDAPVIMTWGAGGFPYEPSFNIIDPEGMIVFSADAPDPGEIYNELGSCPSCLSPIDAFMSDVNANNAQVSWSVPSGYTGNYVVEYDTLGFTLGEGTVVSTPHPASFINLTGLQEKTLYEAYVFLDCGVDSSMLIGPLEFETLWLVDVGVSGITSPTDAACNLSSEEEVTVNLTNFGQLPQTLFEFYFAVNGQVASIPVPQDGFFTGVVGNDSTQNIAFETTWDFSEPGYYIVEAWTELEGDSEASNDTFRVEIITAFPKPISEDFEDEAIPAGWVSDGFLYGPGAHNNDTWVIGRNIYSFVPSFILETSRIGPVEVGDSLTFDYRYVNWFAGDIATELGSDMLEVQISEDCGDSYETVLTIDSSSHISSTDMANRLVLLDDYDGKAINIRFLGTWGVGDYWLDLDNINVSGCPVSFALLGNVQGSLAGGATGSVTVEVNLGTAPFTYDWDNGGNTQTITDLPEGQYTVTVTDANGCTDSRTYEVGIFVSADEVSGIEQVSLFPNPTSGFATLDVTLVEAMDFQVNVLNMNGQVVFSNEKTMVSQVREELDFSNQSPGMYILQIIADGQPHYAKLMVTK